MISVLPSVPGGLLLLQYGYFVWSRNAGNTEEIKCIVRQETPRNQGPKLTEAQGPGTPVTYLKKLSVTMLPRWTGRRGALGHSL
jgi:hypothetical protein